MFGYLRHQSLVSMATGDGSEPPRGRSLEDRKELGVLLGKGGSLFPW